MKSKCELNQQVSDLSVLVNMITGFSLSYLIFAIAEIGLPEAMGTRAIGLDELSDRTNVKPSLLWRILRPLICAGLVEKVKEGKFKLTELGATLRTNHPKSVRDAITMCAHEGVRSWAKLAEGLQRDEIPFRLHFGAHPFELQATDGEMFSRFVASMRSSSIRKQEMLLTSYNFAGVRRVVDVGAGCGILVAAILRNYPAIRATLFDLEHVIPEAIDFLKDTGMADRCTFVAGSFFNAVPEGGDLYALSRVLHDWDDEKAKIILKNCRRAMRRESRMIIIDKVLPESGLGREHLKLMMDDLNVWVMCGGKERTASEFCSLLLTQNLVLKRIIPASNAIKIIEAVPV